VFRDAAPTPAHQAVIDRCRRTILRRAIAPATAALQYMHDAADDSAIVRPLDAPDICRQVRLDPLPLLIAQPKQVAAHDPNPLPKTNQDRIVRAEKLISSDPSRTAGGTSWWTFGPESFAFGRPGQTATLVSQGLQRVMQALSSRATIDLRRARYQGYGEWIAAMS